MTSALMINGFDTLKPTQSTAEMVRQLAHRQQTHVFGVDDIFITPAGSVCANARLAAEVTTTEALVERLRSEPPRVVDLSSCDRVLLRTNPGRDPRHWAHDFSLSAMEALASSGTSVINSPDGLRAAATKAFLFALPEATRPATLVSCSVAQLEDFVRSRSQPSVLKPVRGSRGDDVFKVGPSDPNLSVIISALLRQGFVMAQAFVPEAVDGDTRVVVLDGEVFELGGHSLAIRRRPAAKEFRSNIHAGGTAEVGTVTPEMRAVVKAIAPTLMGHGLRLVGLDFLGAVLCEVNVFSTGGFTHAEEFSGQPFMSTLLDRLSA